MQVLGRLRSLGRLRFEAVSPRLALHAFQEGRGSIEVNGCPHEVGPGDLFVFFPGQHCCYHDDPGRPWRYTWVGLAGKQAAAVLGELGFTRASPRLRLTVPDALEPCFLSIERAFARAGAPSLFAVTAAWRLVEAILDDVGPVVDDAVSGDLARRIRLFLDHEFMRPITLADVAAHLDVDRSTVYRHFSVAFGLSPKQYLDRLRLDQARELLTRTHGSVKEIGRKCGFPNAHCFRRAFKRTFGLAPTQWRARQVVPQKDEMSTSEG
jgi:AraC-like DNA-binding protein